MRSCRCALMVAVIVLCTTAVPPGRACCPAVEVALPVSTSASPGGFTLAETLLLYVIDTLSPTLSSLNRVALCGHVDRLELAIGRLDVHDALGVIDGLHGAHLG